MQAFVERAKDFLKLPFRLAFSDLGAESQDHCPSYLFQFPRNQRGFVIAPFPYGERVPRFRTPPAWKGLRVTPLLPARQLFPAARINPGSWPEPPSGVAGRC